MSYRLTSTEKWKDGWFLDLSPEAKSLFEFIRDNCDIAGFWEVNLKLASLLVGIPKESLETFEQVRPQRGIEGAYKELARGLIGDGKYVWVKNFLYHQKNLPLNNNNPVHRGIMKIIDSHNSFGVQVLQEIDKQITEKKLKGATEGLHSPTGNSNSNSKGNSNSKEEEKNEFDEFRKIYLGTKRGLETEFSNFCKKHKNWRDILPSLKPAIEKQIEQRRLLVKAGKFVPDWKHLKTWINNNGWEEELTTTITQVAAKPIKIATPEKPIKIATKEQIAEIQRASGYVFKKPPFSPTSGKPLADKKRQEIDKLNRKESNARTE